ncbi:MAG: translation initiation factor IF-2 N-terminal domain-containing protein, partial [Clostridia bacterium]|nr:translation initiation factor IF-2 N-terminal domain-containing protein [Clostridia bacterium]
MSKLKVQEATKELSVGVGRLLEEVSGVRRAAQETMLVLRRLENAFLQEEELRNEQQKIEAQRQILDSQSKAWTMPDAEEAQTDLEQELAAPQEQPALAQAGEEAPESPEGDAAAPKAARPKAKEAAPVGAASGAASPAIPAVTQFDPGIQLPGEGPRQPVARPAQTAAFQRSAQGRPFGQSPQGGPARPFGQSPQGGPARPFGQSPQGGPARPFGQSPQGGPARPFGQSPQGGPVRPFGQQAQGGRPAVGGPARPGMGRPGAGRGKGPELAPSMEKERVSNYDPNKRMYQRQHDPERQAHRNRKQMSRGTGMSMDDDVVRGGRRARRKISAQMMMEPIKIEKAYMTAETITVKDLTERIGKPAGEIIKKLLLLGTMATINQELDF